MPYRSKPLWHNILPGKVVDTLGIEKDPLNKGGVFNKRCYKLIRLAAKRDVLGPDRRTRVIGAPGLDMIERASRYHTPES